MSEGGAPRPKRNSARIFKNPPQPHMCIKDYIRGFATPCYINVLSWDKVATQSSETEPVPLYGGMRLTPPRSETREVYVFAVIANPQVLRLRGKNADAKDRSTLIELLLDFVEAVNEGLFFSRLYSVLEDRDITGELKAVWMVVQQQQDCENAVTAVETWIDDHSKLQQQQQIQQQQMNPRSYNHLPSQPPQYTANAMYDCSTYYNDQNYRFQSHIQQYQDFSLAQQYANSNGHPNPNSVYGMASNGNMNQPMAQSIRQPVNQPMGQPMGPSIGLPIGQPMTPNLSLSYTKYLMMQQQVEQQQMQLEQQQLEHQQIHLEHQQLLSNYELQRHKMLMNHAQPTQQFDPNYIPPQVKGVLKLHRGSAPKSNSNKRQNNSPTHSKQPPCGSCQKDTSTENVSKPKSPVKVLQREPATADKNNTSQTSIEKVISPDKSSDANLIHEIRNVQVTDLDESDVRTNDFPDLLKEVKIEVLNILKKKNTETKSFSSVVSATSNEDKQTNQKVERIFSKWADEFNNELVKDTEVNATSNGFDKSKTDSPKRTQSTVNNIIKSVFKIQQNENFSTNTKVTNDTEDVPQGYTILRKPDFLPTSTSDEVNKIESKIAQISVKDVESVDSPLS